MTTHSSTPQRPTYSDPWSDDREVVRVNARMREQHAAAITALPDDDYREALRRAGMALS